jgi:hypothetical protein
MKPQILAVKIGYNPNSSSIGIWVKIFVYQSFIVCLLFPMLRFLLNFKKKKASEGENTTDPSSS